MKFTIRLTLGVLFSLHFFSTNLALATGTSIGSLSELADVVQKLGKEKPKVGIYVGSFDPFHVGHLSTIRAAIAAENLDHVLLFPNNRNSHKADRTLLTLRMAALMPVIQEEAEFCPEEAAHYLNQKVIRVRIVGNDVFQY